MNIQTNQHWKLFLNNHVGIKLSIFNWSNVYLKEYYCYYMLIPIF